MFCYRTIPVTTFQQNCSLIWCSETRCAALIDPGGDLSRLLEAINLEGVSLEQILVTHAHIDHAGAVGRLAREAKVPILGPHPDDQFWIDLLPNRAACFGLPPGEVFTPTRWLYDGNYVTLGNCTLQVRHCPGHTPGHVIFFEATTRRAFVGDVLFAGSIGRTDLPRGNRTDLITSIQQNLWPIGDDVIFIPGHGPESTFGKERASNPHVGLNAGK
jgi:glyoxylase-like metal-dependent hydrolase (beta-lactamase superfamily II)